MTNPYPIENVLKLTLVLFQALGDLKEDPGVACDHDGQGQQEQAEEGEHVVCRLMPMSPKTSSCCALREVLGIRDGHVVEQEHLSRNIDSFMLLFTLASHSPFCNLKCSFQHSSSLALQYSHG